MEYSTTLVTTKAQLATYKDDIIHLFSLAFERPMDEKLWEWAFIQNPCGEPIVSLSFFEGTLVGHYAITPYDLTCQGELVKGTLSMTTMVHPEHHKKGIFVTLAEEVYEAAKNLNYDLVFGFPNKNSAPGFERKLGWSIDKDYHVIKVKKTDILPYLSKTSGQSDIDQSSLKFDLSNDTLMDWRLSKPNCDYEQMDGNLIVKDFKGSLDVMYHENDFGVIDDSTDLSLICKCDPQDPNILFDYVFGFRFFNEKFESFPITPSLILSDVF